MDIDELFSGMEKAEIFGRGNYMGEGAYDITLKSFGVKKRFKGGTVFIAEFTIDTSTNPKHAAGTTGSWVPKLELPNTFGDIKSLMFACLGLEPLRVPAGDPLHAQATLLARAACGSEPARKELAALKDDDGQPLGLTAEMLIGSRVHLECVQTKTREGKDFTRYTFSPVSEDAEAA